MGVKRLRRGIEKFTEHAEVGFLVKKPIYNKRRRKSSTRCLISSDVSWKLLGAFMKCQLSRIDSRFSPH